MKLKKSNWEKVLGFLTYRPRSSHEVQSYLIRKKIGTEEAEKILNRLGELNFLNDKEFASWLVDQRGRLRPEGKRAIKQELYRKGIAKEIVEEVLQSVDEIALGRLAVEKKKLPREKIIAFLARRGFSWSTIKTVLPQLPGQEVDQW